MSLLSRDRLQEVSLEVSWGPWSSLRAGMTLRRESGRGAPLPWALVESGLKNAKWGLLGWMGHSQGPQNRLLSADCLLGPAQPANLGNLEDTQGSEVGKAPQSIFPKASHFPRLHTKLQQCQTLRESEIVAFSS